MGKTSRFKNRKILFFILVSALTIPSIFFLVKPNKTKSANFTNATATLSNSRFSFTAGYASGSSGSSNVAIDTSGNPDNNVNHLFIGDTVCIVPTSYSGCRDNRSYSVVGTEGQGGDQFTISPALVSTPNATDLIVATQSGILTIQFTLANNVPDGGDILITIPSDNDTNSTTSNDGFPDVTDTVANGGFDLNGITATHVSTSTTTSGSCNNAHWSTTETITPGNGTTDHTIRIDRSGSQCEANNTVITVTIGTTSKGIVNPAPRTTSHTQGVADVYTIDIKTRDNTDQTIDNSKVMVAPVEGVFVSATVPETLSFQVQGEASGNTRCGQTTDITTTATAIPWGTISSTNTFYEGSQILTVSTNAVSGYNVYIEENDQMGKDGVTCTGTAPSAGQFTFGSATCIRDTVCGATACSESAARYWTSATNYPGLGISLANLSGTDATWVYDSTTEPCTTTGGGTSTNFCARQIADIQGGETRTSIMSNTGPVNANQIYACFRIAIPGTQPAGYYYNVVKYTAVPIF
jgi:hypothetical protein